MRRHRRRPRTLRVRPVDAKQPVTRETALRRSAGGSGNDIQAVIADEEDYTNWINFLDDDLNYKKAESYY
jgi:hypothetical protein